MQIKLSPQFILGGFSNFFFLFLNSKCVADSKETGELSLDVTILACLCACVSASPSLVRDVYVRRPCSRDGNIIRLGLGL